uniref:Uncharacterized protein n=1 Tax=Schlesneria paludicola TaxID=360056 RepID=A0A7C4LMU2_9PLAN
MLWRLREGDAMRLSEIHREIGEYRERHRQQAPAVTTVSSTLRSALDKGLLKDVRLVGGKVQSAPPASGRGLVASRSPQTAYQAAVTASDVLLPQVRQLIECARWASARRCCLPCSQCSACLPARCKKSRRFSARGDRHQRVSRQRNHVAPPCATQDRRDSY